MNAKHQGLASFGIILAAVAIVAGYGYVTSEKVEHVSVRRTPPIPDIRVPNGREVKEINRLMPIIDTLEKPADKRTAAPDLSIFGYFPASPTKRISHENDNKHPKYSLTFTFDAKRHRTCLIDGAFYTEGSTLPDGAVIVTIAHKRVLIEKQQHRKWISLAHH